MLTYQENTTHEYPPYQKEKKYEKKRKPATANPRTSLALKATYAK
jgi:hypothetical protein